MNERDKSPPWWHILKVIRILNEKEMSVTLKFLNEIFIKLEERGVKEYNFRSGPYGKSSLDFLYDCESLHQSGEISKDPIRLTDKGKERLSKYSDEKFMEEAKMVINSLS